MIPHDILTLYSAKMVEYLIAFAFLFLFIPFWKYVNGGRVVDLPATVRAARPSLSLADWFQVPSSLFFHPGHAWARQETGDVVTVGLDDFAQKLVGPLSGLVLPGVGTTIEQGETGWSLVAAGQTLDMLSPIDGTIAAVNPTVLRDPDAVGRDPYGEGWLLKVQAPRVTSNLKQLLSGSLAARWIEDLCVRLRQQMDLDPDLGLVYEDGGVATSSIARGLDAEHWDEIARTYLLTPRDEADHA
jgi:glycine cleavage system H protein